MTNIVKHIRQRRLTARAHSADIPPALAILAAVQTQRSRDHDMQMLANAGWEELRVDVKRHKGAGVGGCATEARDTVVFRLIEGCYEEGVVEELGVACGRHIECGEVGEVGN